MPKHVNELFRLARDERGMAALEYTLLLAVGAIASTTAVNLVGDQLNATFAVVTEAFARLR